MLAIKRIYYVFLLYLRKREYPAKLLNEKEVCVIPYRRTKKKLKINTKKKKKWAIVTRVII